MMLFSSLRIPALLRRIAKALEESNRIARERMDGESPHVRASRKFDISRPSVEEWNEQHKRTR